MNDRNIVFFAENNRENVKIGNCFCEDGFSIAGYWSGKDNVDYDEITSDCGSFLTNPREEVFKNFFASFLWDLGYKPDYIVIKGNVVDFWGLASLLRSKMVDVPCISIIDDIQVPLNGFEFMVLDQFDINFVLPRGNFRHFIEYLNMINEVGDEEVLENILKKIILLEEFGEVFVKNIEKKEICCFVEEIREGILNNINSEAKISGVVVV